MEALSLLIRRSAERKEKEKKKKGRWGKNLGFSVSSFKTLKTKRRKRWEQTTKYQLCETESAIFEVVVTGLNLSQMF